IVGIAGTDVTSGAFRFTFGLAELADGVSLVAVAMGIFGLGEIIHNLTLPDHARSTVKARLNRILPTRAELAEMAMPILRGTGLGAVLGLLPGGGAMLASFAS